MKRDIKQINLICQSHFALPSARWKQLLDRDIWPLLWSPRAEGSRHILLSLQLNLGATWTASILMLRRGGDGDDPLAVTHCRLVGTAAQDKLIAVPPGWIK